MTTGGRAALLLAAALLASACGDAGAGGEPAREAAAPRADRPVAQESAAAAADTAAGSDTVADGRQRPTTALLVGGHEVRAEVADSDEERRRGLMGRDSLPESHGMLFVYPEQRTLSFWMRNTKIPLDIAFIDRSGVIVDVQTMEPETEELHRSRQPALYALEMEAGWFEEHDVGVGDRVEF